MRIKMVGTPEKCVSLPRRSRSHVHMMSIGPDLNSIQPPACKKRKKLIQIPVAWWTGSMCSITSVSVSWRMRAVAAEQSLRAARRKTVPLGGPVVPDVNMTRPGAFAEWQVLEDMRIDDRGKAGVEKEV